MTVNLSSFNTRQFSDLKVRTKFGRSSGKLRSKLRQKDISGSEDLFPSFQTRRGPFLMLFGHGLRILAPQNVKFPNANADIYVYIMNKMYLRNGDSENNEV